MESNNAIPFCNSQVLVFVRGTSRCEYQGLHNAKNREAAMPVSFLSSAQRESYGRYVGDPSPQELARYFHLDDTDRAHIAEKRGDDNRLGFALQLTTVRFVGTFLEDPAAVPMAVMSTITRQLGIDSSTDLADYRVGKWRFAHTAQIRTDHGYREYTDRTAGFGLTRWLYAQCWTGTERPSSLFDRATTWMLAHKVLLPGATPLERSSRNCGNGWSCACGGCSRAA
jgi:hypothetical protein